MKSFLSRSVYKKAEKFAGNNVELLLLSVSIILATIVMMYGFYAAPIADVWKYHNDYTEAVNNGGLLKFLDTSMHHTGRILQWTIMFLSFSIFGMAAVKIVPVIMFSGLIAAILWVLHKAEIFNYKDNSDLRRGLVLSLLLASVIIMLMPSFFDVYLWLDSSVSYLGSIIAAIVIFGLIYTMITKKTNWHYRAVSLVFIALAQTLSEPASALMIGFMFVYFAYVLYKKNREKIRISLAILLSMVLGFCILYFSPGSIARRQSSPDFSMRRIFIDSLAAYSNMIVNYRIWIILFTLLVLSIILLVKRKHVRFKRGQLLAAAALAFFASTYCEFALNNYTQDYIPDRVLAMPVFGTILAAFIVALFLIKRYYRVIDKYKPRLSLGVFAVAILCMPYLLFISSKNISKLAARDRVSSARNAQLEQQIRSGSSKITVLRAPNLLRGNADDFYYADGVWDKHGRNWITNSYLQYMGIDPDDPELKVELVDPDDTYR